MEKGIEQGYRTMLMRLIKEKYSNDDLSWLSSFQIEQFERISTLLLQNLSFEEFKEKAIEKVNCINS